MSPEEIHELRVRLGMTQQKMAERLGTSLGTVVRWEKDRAKPRGLYLKALEELARRGK